MKILLWKIRMDKNITLVELAKMSGVGKTTINDIENGKISPKLDQLESFAKALDMKIVDFFESEYKM